MYDLVELYRILDWEYPTWFTIPWQIGSVTFVVLSGLCVTLGSRSVRRGAIVFGCGMLVTAVTYGMYLFGFHHSIIIYFGVLQCLGACMMLWPLFKRLPWWALTVLGVGFVALGLWLASLPGIDGHWLMIFGLPDRYFSSSDYFPLFPNLGFFLLGAAIGRTAYRKKETLLPKVDENSAPVRFLQWWGKNSLFIYLAHQPILAGLCMLLWPVFRKLPWWALLILGGLLIWGGFYVRSLPRADVYYLMPLGLPWEGFSSSDYFPLLPNLGYFLVGAALGRTVYRKKETLLPKVREDMGIVKFLCFCGRQSLWIYLLHQPVLSGICMILQAVM
jgi:uncharacterized membrane protein